MESMKTKIPSSFKHALLGLVNGGSVRLTRNLDKAICFKMVIELSAMIQLWEIRSISILNFHSCRFFKHLLNSPGIYPTVKTIDLICYVQIRRKLTTQEFLLETSPNLRAWRSQCNLVSFLKHSLICVYSRFFTNLLCLHLASLLGRPEVIRLNSLFL